MSDLISRSALIEALKTQPKYQIELPRELGDALSLITNHHNKVIEVIENQPIAYNVDAVVEELKKFGKCHRCLNNHNSIGKCAEFCDVAKRIEIVRKGGV